MSEIFFISLGAILGANTRFRIHSKLEKLNISKDFLILIINTFASFSFGLFLSIIEQLRYLSYSYQLILFFSIGFLGSLSTFSAFVYDLFDLCLQFKFLRAFKLFLISLSFGLIAFTVGFLLGN